MRTLIVAALVAIAFGAGYFTHAKLADDGPQRADHSETDLAARRSEIIATLSEEERETVLKTNYPELARMRADAKMAAEASPTPAEADESAGTDAPGEEEDQIEVWLRSASSQWKAYAAMQAKSKVRGLLAGLGFDAETAMQIEDAIVGDVERQVDRAIAMMLGEEDMDASAFTAMLGIPPDLTDALEKELGAYLDDDEINSVRERVQTAHKKQMTDMADMQVATMGIRDLSDDQKNRMREIFIGQDMMTKQMTQFSELTRNRKKMMNVLQDETVQALRGLREERAAAGENGHEDDVRDDEAEEVARPGTRRSGRTRSWPPPLPSGSGGRVRRSREGRVRRQRLRVRAGRAANRFRRRRTSGARVRRADGRRGARWPRPRRTSR